MPDATDLFRSLLKPDTIAQAVSGNWASVAGTLAAANIGSVTFRSQVSPDVTVDPFAPAPPDTAPNPFMLFVKPEITVRDRQGQIIASVAPYGAPTENYVPRLVIGGIVMAVGAVTVIAWLGALLERKRKR